MECLMIVIDVNKHIVTPDVGNIFNDLQLNGTCVPSIHGY